MRLAVIALVPFAVLACTNPKAPVQDSPVAEKRDGVALTAIAAGASGNLDEPSSCGGDPSDDSAAPSATCCGGAQAQPTCGDVAAAADAEEAPASRTCGGHAEPHVVTASAHAPASFDHAPAKGEKATCLVMNREFVIDERTATSVYEGKTYAFCCDGCKQAFDENPGKYASLASATDAKGESKTAIQ